MRFLYVPFPRVFIALGLWAVTLASCHSGNAGYTPSATTPQNIPFGRSEPYQAQIPEPAVTFAPFCSNENLPGTYVNVIAQGTVHNGTFTWAAGVPNSYWIRAHYVANAAPTPKPTATPVHPPYYFYVGTYTDKHRGIVDTVGCAVLVTTQSGNPIPRSRYNGASINAPHFARNISATYIGSIAPVISLKVTGLSLSGGSGTYVLSDGSTGVIKYTHRYSLP